MLCNLVPLYGTDGFICFNCQRKYSKDEQIQECNRKINYVVTRGVGNHLEELIHQLGGSRTNNCNCELLIEKINQWGIEGCQKEENRKEIINQLKISYSNLSLKDRIIIGFRSIKEGFLTYNILIDEAIWRYQQEQVDTKSNS